MVKNKDRFAPRWEATRLRLKRLEIQGFKSFAERTVVEFGPGLTSVVGPNGSGKSNLVDAIRWVLGEQNPRVLRAQRMDDLIFSGSATRRGVSICEVTAVIDNADHGLAIDYDEVSITRRMTRDGVSDYYINKVACRLKDVTDLFSDTGVGREAYSVVGQGKIDEILLAKPEDRRGLFEEASGIVRFRNRKREALRKLEETEEGQVRLNDIIREIEGQIGPLLEQAAKAATFAQLESQLRSLEIGREIHKSIAIVTALSTKRSEAQALNARSVRDRERLEQAESELTEATAGLSLLDAELATLAMALSGAEAELQKTISDGALAAERLRATRENVARATQTKQQADARLSAIRESLEREREAHSASEGSVASAGLLVQQAEDRLKAIETSYREVFASLELKRWEILGLQSEESQVSSDARLLASLAANAYGEALRLRDEIAAKTTGLESARAKAVEHRELLSGHESEIETTKKELAARRNEVLAASQEAARLVAEVEKKRRALASVSGKASALEEMRDRFDGYAEGPRRILSMGRAGKVAGILGSVADVLKVRKGYERAMEAALGGAAQFVVVLTAADAEEAIARLKSSQAGRATFLPLDTIRESSLNSLEVRALDETPGAMPATEVVSCDERFLPVVHNLLGRCAVVPDVASAVKLGRITSFGVRIATLDGDLVSPGGSITGGSRAEARPGLFTRQAEIDRLQEEVLLARQDLEKAEALLETTRAVQAQAEEARAAAERRQRQVELDVQNTRALLQASIKEAEALERDLQLLANKALDQENAARTHCDSAKNGMIRVAGMQSRRQALEEAVQGIAGTAEAADAERRAAYGAVSAAKENLARAQEISLAAAKSVALMEKQLAEAQAQSENSLVELTALYSELASLEGSVGQIEEAQKAAAATRDKAKDAEGAARQTRDSEAARIAALERSVRQISRTLDTITVRLIDVTAEETRLSTSLSGLEENLVQRFGLTLKEAGDAYQPLDESVDPSIQELKDEIASLGPVNPQAPIELERARERLSFMSVQNSDLEKARVSLLKVIDEMDSKMAQMFKESFETIRTNFRQIFRELFNGGEADLVLTDPDNALESGVEITARPTGRTTQTLSLLSGGERCLSAIALLFAMQRLRPSPFCVLDEIEASLDEANVERFCSFITRLGDVNQYILITHQKRTMEVSDVLYGLTIQETGVSKTLSIKLAGNY